VKGELEMAKVYRLYEVQLRDRVKAEDFEKFMIDEWYPLPVAEGWDFLGLSGVTVSMWRGSICTHTWLIVSRSATDMSLASSQRKTNRSSRPGDQ
jgi:hypothetical protein